MYNNELYHFGVKGMRWGHRKSTDQYTIEQTRSMNREGIAKAKYNYRNSKRAAKQKRNNTTDSRQAKINYKSDIRKAKKQYKQDIANNDIQTTKNLRKTSYSSVLKDTWYHAGVGMLSYGAGRMLVDKGYERAGGILKLYGTSRMGGALIGNAANAGAMYVAKHMKQ